MKKEASVQHVDESTRQMIEEEARRKQEEGGAWFDGSELATAAEAIGRGALEVSYNALSTAGEVGCAAAHCTYEVGSAVLSGVAEVLSALG